MITYASLEQFFQELDAVCAATTWSYELADSYRLQRDYRAVEVKVIDLLQQNRRDEALAVSVAWIAASLGSRRIEAFDTRIFKAWLRAGVTDPYNAAWLRRK